MKENNANSEREWMMLSDKDGRFYVKQKRSIAAPPAVVCVDSSGDLIAEAWTNMSGGITFSTFVPLSDADTSKVFHALKAEVPKR